AARLPRGIADQRARRARRRFPARCTALRVVGRLAAQPKRAPPARHGRDAAQRSSARAGRGPRLREHWSGILRSHAPAVGLSRRDGSALRRRGRPRNGRAPHRRGHDAHVRRGPGYGPRRPTWTHPLRRGPGADGRGAGPRGGGPLGSCDGQHLHHPRPRHGRARLRIVGPDGPYHPARDRQRRERPPRRGGLVQGRRPRPGPGPHPRRVAGAFDEGLVVSEVVVVDYGAGNTHSVRAALSRLGRTSEVSSDREALLEAPFVVLPGVGSARSAMVHLHETGADVALHERFSSGGPILGICLGMQLALETTEEDGGVAGLGLLSGHVTRLTTPRVPRLGWAMVEPWNEAYYFAHSYAGESP